MSKRRDGRGRSPDATPPADGLALEDTGSMKARGLRRRVSSTGASRHDPYDLDLLEKRSTQSATAKRTDLRKLSEIIKLKNRVAALKREVPPSPSKSVLRRVLDFLLARD